MSDDKTFFSNAVGVTGFLGGITFATMVLLIQSGTEIHNSELMIPATAIISVLFIIATIGNMHIANDSEIKNEKLTNSMGLFAQLGFFGLMIIIPVLVYPFNNYGAGVVAVLEVIVVIVFVVYRHK